MGERLNEVRTNDGTFRRSYNNDAIRRKPMTRNDLSRRENSVLTLFRRQAKKPEIQAKNDGTPIPPPTGGVPYRTIFGTTDNQRTNERRETKARTLGGPGPLVYSNRPLPPPKFRGAIVRTF